MASITIRQLDDDLKRRLRLRAARHGRSMEDEVRTILRHASLTAAVDDGATPERARTTARTARHRDAAATLMSDNAQQVMTDKERHDRHHVLLIIGGGIAAYKSLDLI